MSDNRIETEREILERHAAAYMMWGDLDKPFHRPECSCLSCEAWRAEHDRPTHAELRRRNAK